MFYNKNLPWSVILLLTTTLTGCLGGSSSDSVAIDESSHTAVPDTTVDSTVTPNGSTTSTIATVQGNTAGRLLASNCFQCHGTNGSGGFDRILGKSDVLQELREYMGANAGSDIMAAHTQGYTDAQLQAIATYLSNP